MAAPLIANGAGKYLQLVLLWVLIGLGTSCQSARLSPQYSQQTPSAIAIDSLIRADTAVEAFIQPYKARLDMRMDSIIGYAARELQRQEVESALGNFVADLMLESARRVTDRPIDLSVMTIGGLRVPLPAGPIRMGDLFELMPFENMIVVLELSGEQAWQLFEFAAQKKIAAMANTQIKVREGKPVEVLIGGEAFDPQRTYTIATHDYLAGGGDNMAFFKGASRIHNTDILVRSAIVNKIVSLQQAGKQVDAQIEGRVEILD